MLIIKKTRCAEKYFRFEMHWFVRCSRNVYGTIGNKPVHIDKIVSELGIPVFKVLTALTQLEMKGLVTAMQGRMYVLK